MSTPHVLQRHALPHVDASIGAVSAVPGINCLVGYPPDESPAGRIVEFLDARVEAGPYRSAPEYIDTQGYHDGMGFALAVLTVADVIAVLDELYGLREVKSRAEAATRHLPFAAHERTAAQEVAFAILWGGT